MLIKNRRALERYKKNLEIIRKIGLRNPNESYEEKQIAIEKSKQDYDYCVKRYFPHYATCDSGDFQIQFANKVKRDKLIKAFAQWGRGLAKSVITDITLAFWLMINDEAHYMVLIGINFDRACELLADLQAELAVNPQIISDFGEQKIQGSWEEGFFKTKSGFIGKALGIGQSVRGLRIQAQRPDLCVIDDIETKQTVKNAKRQDEYVKWVEHDLLPTMDGPIRRLLYSNNRFAPRMIQTELQKKHPGWHVSHVPAYDRATYNPAWPQKYSQDYYRILESEIGLIACQAEYLQDPIVDGTIFTREQIIFAQMPRLNHFKIIVGHWDVAYAGTATADYNAVRVWGLDNPGFNWLIACYVRQSKMKAAIEWMCDFQSQLPRTVIVHWRFEAQFWNDEVLRTIEEVQKEKKVTLLITKVDTPRTKKYDRILTLQPRYQNSRIRYNKNLISDPDTQQGIIQLCGIEPGYSGNDDAPDADQQAIAFLDLHTGGFSPAPMSGRMTPKNERI